MFGFAQSVEQSAAPLTAFLIGPLTQFLAIPFMTTGAGAEAIGGWYGIGPERGMALVFSVTGILGVILTAIAFQSRQYRQLSETYASGPGEDAPAAIMAEGAVEGFAAFAPVDDGDAAQVPPGRG